MNAKQRRQAKRHPEVRKNPKHVGHPPKIGVEKGRGPRHADNSKEGEDLTRVDTDTVPAMLTPREAVLNRNAAEMAGRGNIEALNERGNLLAKKGVDLAGGETMQSKPKHLAGGDDQVARNPFPGRGPGGVYPGVPTAGPVGPPDQIGGFGGGLGARDEFGRQFSQRNAAGAFGAGHGVPGAADPRGSGPFPSPMGYYNGPPIQVPQPGGWNPTGPMQGGPAPAVPPQAWRQMPSSPFYPPGQGLKMAQGEEDILGNPGSIYGSAAPVSLSSPGGLGDIVKIIQAEAQKQGLSAGQVQAILKAFQGMGGAGGGSGLTVGAGTGNMDAVGAFAEGTEDLPDLMQAAPAGKMSREDWERLLRMYKATISLGLSEAVPALGRDSGPGMAEMAPRYSGGISEVGYPPLISPNADFSYDRGGWVGAYDPRYSFPSY